MKKLLGLVLKFQTIFGQYLSSTPSNVEQKVYSLRHDLMEEENNEYLEACMNDDKVEIADALGDQLYILLGTINTHGMQYIIEDVFEEIHASNMSKLDEEGKPIYREDGKILKGKNYFKPNLKQFFDSNRKAEEKEREKIKLTNSQWRDLVWENYLEIGDKEIKIEEIQHNYDGSRRHTEDHHLIFKRLSDNKYFKISYETSVKDSMGWEECNYGDTEATEVFPEEKITTIYK